MRPFTLTPAAVSHLASEAAEHCDTGEVFRVLRYYTNPLVGKQYKIGPAVPDADDIILTFPDGPLTIAVDRHSFLDMVGEVLDVKQVEGGEPGQLGCWFRMA